MKIVHLLGAAASLGCVFISPSVRAACTASGPCNTSVRGSQSSFNTNGVQGDATSGTGVYGDSASSYGVYGVNANAASPGVYGISGNSAYCSGGAGCGVGVQGNSTYGWGVIGYETATGYGVYGLTTAGITVYGVTEGGVSNATGPYGVYGSNNEGDAIHGVYNGSGGSSGVAGIGSTSGYGVSGQASSPYYSGVAGHNTSGAGVAGTSSTGIGVTGVTEGGTVIGGPYGVFGSNSIGDAIHGYYNGTGASSAVAGTVSTTGDGVYGAAAQAGYYGIAGYTSASTGYSAFFNGGKGVNLNSGASYWSNGVCAAGPCVSDRRLKDNIEPLTGALETLLRLRGVTFTWKEPKDHGGAAGLQRGFIAQEVEKVFPEWVVDNSEGYKTVNLQPAQIASLVVEAIRQLQKENDELKERVALIEAGHPVPAGVGGFPSSGAGWGVAGVLFGLLIAKRKSRA